MELSLHTTNKRDNSLKNILETENLGEYLNGISRTIIDWKDAEGLYYFIVDNDMERDDNLEIARITFNDLTKIIAYYWASEDIRSVELLSVVDKIIDWEQKDAIIMWGV